MHAMLVFPARHNSAFPEHEGEGTRVRRRIMHSMLCRVSIKLAPGPGQPGMR